MAAVNVNVNGNGKTLPDEEQNLIQRGRGVRAFRAAYSCVMTTHTSQLDEEIRPRRAKTQVGRPRIDGKNHGFRMSMTVCCIGFCHYGRTH